MKRLLHFAIAFLFFSIIIPATKAASSYNPSTLIERIPGGQCQFLGIMGSGAVIKFNHVPSGDLVLHSTNPENWQTSNGTRSCDIGVVMKRSFIPHNGVTLYEGNDGSGGIAYDARLYPLRLSDYSRILQSSGALSIADHAVLEGGKPLVQLGAPSAAVRVSSHIDLQIDVPDNFSGLISLSGRRDCVVDFDQLHNCSIRGVFYDTLITARELSNLKSLDLLASSSTVHLHNVSTDLLRMGDASVRYPSKFCIDSGAAKRGYLSGREEDFKLNGDFSALRNNFSPIVMPHRNTPKPTY